MRYLSRAPFLVFFCLSVTGCRNTDSAGSTTGGSGSTGGGSNGALLSGGTGSAQDSNMLELLAGNSTGGGNATIEGTVKGDGFTPLSAVYDIVGDSAGNVTVAYIAIASDGNFCNAIVQNMNQLKSSTHITLSLYSITAASQLATVSNGTFDVSTNAAAIGNLATVGFRPLDNDCNLSLAAAYVNSQTGSVTLTNLTTAGASGSFSVGIGSQGDALSGTFQAAPCPGFAGVELAQNLVLGCQ